MSNSQIEFDGYRPGAVGDIVRLHAIYYAEHWGFGPDFEASCALGFGEILRDYREGRDRLGFAYLDGRAVGSCQVDGRLNAEAGVDNAARLRFVIVDPALAGKGIGRKLIGDAVDWIDRAGYGHSWLTTFDGLGAARHLYEAAGFTLTETYTASSYGRPLPEQRFDRVR